MLKPRNKAWKCSRKEEQVWSSLGKKALTVPMVHCLYGKHGVTLFLIGMSYRWSVWSSELGSQSTHVCLPGPSENEFSASKKKKASVKNEGSLGFTSRMMGKCWAALSWGRRVGSHWYDSCTQSSLCLDNIPRKQDCTRTPKKCLQKGGMVKFICIQDYTPHWSKTKEVSMGLGDPSFKSTVQPRLSVRKPFVL